MKKILLAVVLAVGGCLAGTGVALADPYGHGHHYSHHSHYYRGGYGGYGCAPPVHYHYRPYTPPPSASFYYYRGGGYPAYHNPRGSFGIYFGF